MRTPSRPILINTVYFKGNWLYQFDAENTKPADFHLPDGSTVQVDMMSQQLPLASYRSDEVQMAELAYGDSLYKMTILMPGDAEKPIDSFVQESLTASKLSDWTSQLRITRDTRLKLPKFESSYKKKLNDVLKSLGMDEAFDKHEANFSKINSGAPLFISKVMHKANITVNEEGSEAAGATSVGINLTSAPPSFRVNRPFVYLIRERISGTVLFMGVMKNPEL